MVAVAIADVAAAIVVLGAAVAAVCDLFMLLLFVMQRLLL